MREANFRLTGPSIVFILWNSHQIIEFHAGGRESRQKNATSGVFTLHRSGAC